VLDLGDGRTILGFKPEVYANTFYKVIYIAQSL
jgi:hypothetical protein